jgi:ABC-2 type transport system permease protein
VSAALRGWLATWTDIYGALLRVGIAGQIQYRASGAIWMIGSILEPVVFLSVWSAVAVARGGSVGGLEPPEFAAYYLATLFANHFTFTWVIHTAQYRVQHGQLAFELLRPLHPLHVDLADNLAYKLVMSVVLLPGAALLALSFGPRFHASAGAWLALPFALLLGLAVRVFSEWTLSLAAFWTTRSDALAQVYMAVLVLLSGRLAPVDLLPGPLAPLAHASPFYSMVGFPVDLALGRLDARAALLGFAAQLAWAAAGLALTSVTWRAAVRRFSAVGG